MHTEAEKAMINRLKAAGKPIDLTPQDTTREEFDAFEMLLRDGFVGCMQEPVKAPRPAILKIVRVWGAYLVRDPQQAHRQEEADRDAQQHREHLTMLRANLIESRAQHEERIAQAQRDSLSAAKSSRWSMIWAALSAIAAIVAAIAALRSSPQEKPQSKSSDTTQLTKPE